MNESRLQELRHLIRTNVPVPVVSERAGDTYGTDLYDDHFTLRELVQGGMMTYLGHKEKIFFLRPMRDFKIFVLDEIRELKGGEFVQLSLTDAGRADFVRWLEDGAI